jgi:hypothetical protein
MTSRKCSHNDGYCHLKPLCLSQERICVHQGSKVLKAKDTLSELLWVCERGKKHDHRKDIEKIIS